MATQDLPLLTFANAAAFERWLSDQPGDAAGAWLRFAKQGAPDPIIAKTDAIDCALAHGWIDGRLGGIDAHYFKTRFTPRRPRSAWSQLNCRRVEQLIAAGRMAPRGLAQVELARSDGRWEAAYAPQGRATPDADLIAALEASPSALAFFEALDSANRYAVLYRLHQAKTPERRAAKLADLVGMLARGESFHPRRQRR